MPPGAFDRGPLRCLDPSSTQGDIMTTNNEILNAVVKHEKACDDIVHESFVIAQHVQWLKAHPGSDRDRKACGAAVCKIVRRLVTLQQLQRSK